MQEEYKGDIGLYLSGQQVKIPSVGIFITQPTIKDIVLTIGESDFMTAAYLLSDIAQFASTIRQGKTELNNIPDFQIVIEVLRQKSGQFTNIIDNFFSLCLPQFSMECSAHSLDFSTEDDTVVGMLNAFNYPDFALAIKELFLPRQKEEAINYRINEADEVSKRLLEKVKKNRELLAKQRSAKDGDNLSMFGLYISILSVGMGVDVNMFYKYTPFQLYDTFNRFLAKAARDKYESMLLVPFADTSALKDNEPPSWFENLYKPVEEEYNSLQKVNEIGSSAK